MGMGPLVSVVWWCLGGGGEVTAEGGGDGAASAVSPLRAVALPVAIDSW